MARLRSTQIIPTANFNPLIVRNNIRILPGKTGILTLTLRPNKTFEDMIRTELIKLGFKITSKILPNPLIMAFEQDGGKTTHPYNTRNKSLPNIQKHTTSLYNTSFMCKALTENSKALVMLKQKKTVHSLGKAVWKYLIAGY